MNRQAADNGIMFSFHGVSTRSLGKVSINSLQFSILKLNDMIDRLSLMPLHWDPHYTVNQVVTDQGSASGIWHCTSMSLKRTELFF